MAVVDDDPWTWPRGRQLAWRNRQIIAARMAWPDGALEACERIERAYPDWSPGWRHASTIAGFEAPAGFYARPDGTTRGGWSYGEAADALVKAIEARTSRCQSCGAIVPVPAASETPAHLADADGRWCYARAYQLTMDLGWSHCPRCVVWFDAPVGSDVPPHQTTDGAGWCPVRCSQKTV